LHLQLPETLPLVYGDAVLLERVLANLFENAAKYTPNDTPITLKAWHREDQIYVEVSDEGPGMPTGDIESLFEKFHRGERESSTSGVGLGLSICRAIVRAHGGAIWARNRSLPERGAILTWTLPFRESPTFNEMAVEIGATDSIDQSTATPTSSAASAA
jgi:two-component system sensor histidine kinase KdpD